MKEQDTECHCSRTSRYHHKDSTYKNHSVERCWTNIPDTNKPPTLVAIGEGNVNKPMNTPDTEFDSDKEVVGSDCLCVLGSKKHNPECEYATPDTEWEKVVEEFYLNFTDIEKQELDTPSWNHNGVTPYLVEQWIRTLLTSRDTYWKERVEEIYGHFSWCQECAEGPMCKDALAIKDNLK